MAGKTVITISRQYGSGGREIGSAAAELLGFKFYDKEHITTLSAQKSGMDKEVLRHSNEKATNSLLYTLAMGSSIFGVNSSLTYDISINDRLFMIQSDIIKELAGESDCLIVGRCGDYVMRDNPNRVSIFIYAPLDERVRRIASIHNMSEGEARDLVAKTDKRRANYYNFYTGLKWGKPENYHISIDSSRFGIKGTARIVADIVRARGQV